MQIEYINQVIAAHNLPYTDDGKRAHKKVMGPAHTLTWEPRKMFLHSKTGERFTQMEMAVKVKTYLSSSFNAKAAFNAITQGVTKKEFLSNVAVKAENDWDIASKAFRDGKPIK